MVSTDPNDKVPHGPEDISTRLAEKLVQIQGVDDDVVERIRNSEQPLDEVIVVDTSGESNQQIPVHYEQSIRGAACTALSYVLEEELDDVLEVNRAKVGNHLELVTHPSVLDHGNRLFPPAALATAYQYGYWLRRGSIVQGGDYSNRFDVDASTSFEFRKGGLSLYTETRPPTSGNQDDDSHWDTIDDADAVTTAADRMTADSVNWERYIPLQQTKIVSAYRISTVAQSLDPTDFPEPPAQRPTIKDRFDTQKNPRVGDFIRWAILRRLEEHYPSILNISTGPGPWNTDEVSLTVRPTERRTPGIDSPLFCPPAVLATLSAYGYRPIDAWYDAPDIGHKPEDPIPPRKFKFARGQTLQDWSQRNLYNVSLTDHLPQIKEHVIFANFDWEILLPCLRTHILRYEDLVYEAHQVS